MASFSVRPAVQADGGFLGDMVVEAANWRPGAALPKHQVITAPEHSRYLSGWQRPTDVGFVALDATAAPIGAAWYRLLPRSEPGFGYVGTGVPELIIGVRPIWRAHGVGRALLQSLTERARADGYARLSLSVERGNFAVTLYRSEGFAVTQSGIGRDTMVKILR
ncbi:GNAT family N-acetyltransferase [Microbacterium sp. zg.B48]|uniref:GNAT family N-acetyltransferase n=1 Tax=unclassified Microbacterium TaxID=2609290 RepID=UPI00214C0F98|nr:MULTISPECIES: GNAT family N-acetyltransferase [unclassified Microbacterium]MCR2764840.1 GNAT family N-acetyltransferase [Microbacterium sp. zg.B48]MCR2810021.1 GNAT family N-acetyltransferase [Microbacterium sp. zg.B185]WIM20138.1 GNAT family N-acetyltransferase [Microbacterium sp. zg-B185]